MTRRKTDRSSEYSGAVTNWFVGMLILLFAALSVALIALGTQAYQAIGLRAEENAQKRISVGYALSRVHAFDTADAVRVEQREIGGRETDVLIFTEWVEDEAYETRMFQADGWLREQFTHAEYPLEGAEDGEPIAELDGFSVALDGMLLEMTFVDPDGEMRTVHAALRSGGEVWP